MIPLHLCSRFSVNKEGTDNQGSFYFMVDYDRFAMKQIFSTYNDLASSSTINLVLTAGQNVQIQNVGSTVIYGIRVGVLRSWFTGHLLYALWKITFLAETKLLGQQYHVRVTFSLN